jgi:hypothetical protein
MEKTRRHLAPSVQNVATTSATEKYYIPRDRSNISSAEAERADSDAHINRFPSVPCELSALQIDENRGKLRFEAAHQTAKASVQAYRCIHCTKLFPDAQVALVCANLSNSCCGLKAKVKEHAGRMLSLSWSCPRTLAIIILGSRCRASRRMCKSHRAQRSVH